MQILSLIFRFLDYFRTENYFFGKCRKKKCYLIQVQGLIQTKNPICNFSCCRNGNGYLDFVRFLEMFLFVEVLTLNDCMDVDPRCPKNALDCGYSSNNLKNVSATPRCFISSMEPSSFLQI